MTSDSTRVTVFGLGEAGSHIAADLVESGVEVHGYDPASVETPKGVIRHHTAGSAVAGVVMVIGITAASDAKSAIAQALDEIDQRVIYADLSTAPPALKEELGRTAASSDLDFVDVALMGTVPGSGVATPSLASGPGAVRYAAAINDIGGNVQVVGDDPGDAAARKLLRSVVTKGLTALVMEAMEAASEHGDAEWMWEHLVELITDADEALLRRFINGTPQHVDRRLAEMDSTREFLQSMGVPTPMTTATVDSLRRVQSDRMPGKQATSE